MSITIASSSLPQESPITTEWLLQLVEQIGSVDTKVLNTTVLEKLQQKSSKYKYLVSSTKVEKRGDVGISTKFGAVWDTEKDGFITVKIDSNDVSDKDQAKQDSIVSLETNEVNKVENDSESVEEVEDKKEPLDTEGKAEVLKLGDDVPAKTEEDESPKVEEESPNAAIDIPAVQENSEKKVAELKEEGEKKDVDLQEESQKKDDEIEAIDKKDVEVQDLQKEKEQELESEKQVSPQISPVSPAPTPISTESKPPTPPPTTTVLSVYWLYVS